MLQIAEEPASEAKPPVTSMVARIVGLWRKLKSPPPGDHGAQRWRKIFISLGSTFFSRILAQACNLLTIPVALHYLGAQRYGVWVTLTSSVGLLSLFDFGIGVGLQNRVAEMLGKDQLGQLSYCLRSTLVVLASISVFVFALVTFCIFRTGLAFMIFRDPHYASINLQENLVIIAGALMIGLPLALFPRIAFGLQQGWIASVAITSGTVLTLVAVFAAALLQVDFTTFVAVAVVPQIAAQAVGYFLLTRRVPGGLPLLGPLSLGEGLKTLKQGSQYVLPQLTGAILMQGPMIFLGTNSSPLNAATYNILCRIGMPFQQFQQMFLVQVWPAITEAMHRGDTGWLRKTLRRILRLNLVFGTAAVGIVALMVLFLFPLLAKNQALRPSSLVIVLYAANVGVMCVVQGLGYIANGLSRMRSQNYLAVISIIFAFAILPPAARQSGIDGVLIAMISLNVLVSLPMLFREYTSYFRQNASY